MPFLSSCLSCGQKTRLVGAAPSLPGWDVLYLPCTVPPHTQCHLLATGQVDGVVAFAAGLLTCPLWPTALGRNLCFVFFEPSITTQSQRSRVSGTYSTARSKVRCSIARGAIKPEWCYFCEVQLQCSVRNSWFGGFADAVIKDGQTGDIMRGGKSAK